ncbi:hypothetical protein [Alteraurantiacibacter buctensis]|uniref:Uncharacterized protein n=1 Tax=Alteraurantiacibacter buctensis TaxID=1503981 RepID=A0A844Z1M4_9SPHN|nr:hypothetical protein [Alteraurantiacibacter buctensis]MXO72891.1 hypothetical protein [Alteraurantiacibacter buctensis]
MKHHFTRHPDTGRATELDPSTFAHPEEFQREPYNPWGMRFVFAWCAFAAGLLAWGVWVLIDAVF